MDEFLGKFSLSSVHFGYQYGVSGKAHLVLHAAAVGAPATRPVLQA